MKIRMRSFSKMMAAIFRIRLTLSPAGVAQPASTDGLEQPALLQPALLQPALLQPA
jgi:hypothetical protein